MRNSKILSVKNLLIVSFVFALCAGIIITAGCNGQKNQYLQRSDWSSDVKDAANSLIAEYGKDGASYKDNNYVVCDFDNTSAIFDVAQQNGVYQLTHMAFNIKPGKLGNKMSNVITDNKDEILPYEKIKNTTYNTWLSEIDNAYSKLYEKYGPFTWEGVDEDKSAQIMEDPYWQEFASKMWTFRDVFSEKAGEKIGVTLIGTWCTDMTEDQVYNLGRKSLSYYKDKDTNKLTVETPATINSKIGVTKASLPIGVSVTENIKELYKALNDNGIKVWICSASDINIVKAAIDTWGLRDSLTGVLALTYQLDSNNLITGKYDYSNGCGYSVKDGKWERDIIPIKDVTHSDGKVNAVKNVLFKKYNQGPIAGLMDSTGDFEFCTEFENLKMVICFNRADRGVTDGGGLIAELAIYQKENLHYDLKKANDAGDTLYVLQGRDERGLRSFRASNKSIIFGSDEEKLFKNNENQDQLDYMIKNNMSTKDICEKFCIKTPADSKDNLLGNIKYGFLKTYFGYHSIK